MMAWTCCWSGPRESCLRVDRPEGRSVSDAAELGVPAEILAEVVPVAGAGGGWSADPGGIQLLLGQGCPVALGAGQCR